MVSNCFVIVATLAFLSLSVCLPTYKHVAEQMNQNGEKPLTLRFLGTVEGKSYFVEANLTMNWTSARAYCKESNLNLGSIETINQSRFLAGELRSHYAGSTFWTSARETQGYTGFVWDSTRLQPKPETFRNWGIYSFTWYYCGRISSVNTTHIDMITYPCSTIAGVLCES